MPSASPEITLNDGVSIPQVGFGVFQVPSEDTHEAVTNALRAGYRHVDTARIYGNEKAVGEAIRDFGLARDEVFVTTKCWNADQGYDNAMRAFDRSLAELGLDHLDLYLIHWPCPDKDQYVGTWRAFEQLAAEGRVRSIGVSNFQIAHLERLRSTSDVVPAVNQIELHPWLPQRELRDYHSAHGIATQAWSPIARGGDHLNNAILKGLADKHGKSVAQVILRWHIQAGNIVLPRTVKAKRAAENISIFDFALDAADLHAIDALATGERVGPDPDVFHAE